MVAHDLSQAGLLIQPRRLNRDGNLPPEYLEHLDVVLVEAPALLIEDLHHTKRPPLGALEGDRHHVPRLVLEPLLEVTSVLALLAHVLAHP